MKSAHNDLGMSVCASAIYVSTPPSRGRFLAIPRVYCIVMSAIFRFGSSVSSRPFAYLPRTPPSAPRSEVTAMVTSAGMGWSEGKIAV